MNEIEFREYLKTNRVAAIRWLVIMFEDTEDLFALHLGHSKPYYLRTDEELVGMFRQTLDRDQEEDEEDEDETAD
jgi:hypothetical protein